MFDRFIVAVVNGRFSQSCATTSGVIHSGFLDPLLFSIYVNGILRYSRHGKLSVLADDDKTVKSFEAGSFSSILAISNEVLSSHKCSSK